MGPLHRSGNGRPIDEEAECSVSDMIAGNAARNKSLIESLKEDEHSDVLFSGTCKDKELHRFHSISGLEEVDLHHISIAKRFGIEQGRRFLCWYRHACVIALCVLQVSRLTVL